MLINLLVFTVILVQNVLEKLFELHCYLDCNLSFDPNQMDSEIILNLRSLNIVINLNNFFKTYHFLWFYYNINT